MQKILGHFLRKMQKNAKKKIFGQIKSISATFEASLWSGSTEKRLYPTNPLDFCLIYIVKQDVKFVFKTNVSFIINTAILPQLFRNFFLS